MTLTDGVRRNIAHVSAEERQLFRDALVRLNRTYYPDGVSKWIKQDRIHQATPVHEGPAFLPWHRELCNRFELLLREVNPALSLHYWDWTEDPRQARDGAGNTVNLFTTEFMGSDNGKVEFPFSDFPPITRSVAGQNNHKIPTPPGVDSDLVIINSTNGTAPNEQWNVFREALEGGKRRNHDVAHGYIGGSISDEKTAFEDPFVFLLHSNVDRLWAMWQTVPEQKWRLDPDKIYGTESHHPEITAALEPWAGKAERPLRPWGPPDYQEEIKNSKDLTIVVPPRYDTKVVLQGEDLVITNWVEAGDADDPTDHSHTH